MRKDPIIIVSFIFAGIFFLGLSISHYELCQENKELRKQVDLFIQTTTDTFSVISSNAREEKNHRIVHSEDLRKLKSQTSVLEASLSSQEMRWARIRKIREAIKVVSNKKLPVDELTDIAANIIDRSDEYDISASLVLAVMKQESNFNREAISIAGARGLLQVMPSTANDVQTTLGVKYYSWSRVSHNIRFGTFYLARMVHSFEDNIDLAIAAYNAGPLLVERVRAGRISSYPAETVDYLEKVKMWKKRFEEEGITW